MHLRRILLLPLEKGRALRTKSITLLTAASFLLSTVAGPAAAAVAVPAVPAVGAPAAQGPLLSAAFGRITDARFYGSKKVVVAIQDLHCHPEVQRNISRIIASLDARVPVSKIFLEGASGPVDTSWAEAVADPRLRQFVVETLLSSGRLTGAEYYAITAKKDNLAGLEDAKLYAANAVRLGRILERQQEIAAVLAAARSQLAQLKARYYSPGNYRLDALVGDARAGDVASDRYYQLLLKRAAVARVETGDCTNLRDYLQLSAVQHSLNYRALSREMQFCMGALRERLSYADYARLAAMVGDGTAPEEFYAALGAAGRGRIDGFAARFPGLNAFLRFHDLNRRISPIALLKEEKRLLYRLHQAFAQSRAEREIAFLSDGFDAYADYLSNKISADDYAAFSRNEGQFLSLWKKYLGAGTADRLASSRALADAFYRANIERNNVFLKNVLGEAPSAAPACRLAPVEDHTAKVLAALRDSEVVVTVTGGFHTPGFIDLLKAKGVSYVVVTPNVREDTRLSDRMYDLFAKEQARLFARQTMAVDAYSDEMRLLRRSVDRKELAAYLLGSAVIIACDAGRSPRQIEADFERLGIPGTLKYQEHRGKYHFLYTDPAGKEITINIRSRETNEVSRNEVQILIDEIEKELRQEGTGNLPIYGAIADIHGGFKRYADFVIRMLGETITINGDGTINAPAERTNKLGTIYQVGDLLDRGGKEKGATKIIRLTADLADKGYLEFIAGNHDLFAFMNLLGLHLPWYDGYNGIPADYNGYLAGNVLELLAEKRREYPETATDPAHWAEKLAEYMRYADRQQANPNEDEGGCAEIELRFKRHFAAMFQMADEQNVKDVLKRPKGTILEKDPELRAWWGKVLGFLAGGEVYTGVRAVDKMSIQWWVDRRNELETMKAKPSQRGMEARWDAMAEHIDWIIAMQKRKMRTELKNGNWEWAVLDAMMYRNYESAEWWAMDWIYHKGWGKALLSEIGETEVPGISEGNYFAHIDGSVLGTLRDFFLREFSVYKKDAYGNVYMHGFLPIDEEGDVNIGRIDEKGHLVTREPDGTPIKGFYYKGVHYSGEKGLFEGFDRLADDIHDYQLGTSLAGIYEALALVTSLYSDATTRIKPGDMAKYKDMHNDDFYTILKRMGVWRLINGHNPISKLRDVEISHSVVSSGEEDYDYRVLMSIDNELSPGYKDTGCFITCGSRGIRGNFISKDAPDTFAMVPDQMVDREIFLKSALHYLKAQQQEEPVETLILPSTVDTARGIVRRFSANAPERAVRIVAFIIAPVIESLKLFRPSKFVEAHEPGSDAERATLRRNLYAVYLCGAAAAAVFFPVAFVTYGAPLAVAAAGALLSVLPGTVAGHYIVNTAASIGRAARRILPRRAPQAPASAAALEQAREDGPVVAAAKEAELCAGRSIVTGSMTRALLGDAFPQLYPNNGDSPVRGIAPRLEGAGYLRFLAAYDAKAKEELARLGHLGINGFAVAPLPQGYRRGGLIDLSAGGCGKLAAGDLLLDVYAERLATDGKPSWALFYDGENLSPAQRAQAALALAAFLEGNTVAQQLLELPPSFHLDVVETGLPRGEQALAAFTAAVESPAFERTVFVADASAAVETTAQEGALEMKESQKLFDLVLQEQDPAARLRAVEEALLRKRAGPAYMQGEPVFATTLDLRRFPQGMRYLASEEFVEGLAALHLDTLVLRSLEAGAWKTQRAELAQLLERSRQKKVRVVFDYAVPSAGKESLQAALGEITSRLSVGGRAFGGVRVDLSSLRLTTNDAAGIAAFLTELRRSADRIDPELVIGVILPEGFAFSAQERQRLAGELKISEVVRFLPGEKPQAAGLAGAWLDMALEKDGRDFTAEFADAPALAGTLQGLFTTKGAGVIGVDYELLSLGRDLFAENASLESFADFCKAGVDAVVRGLRSDPAHRYAEGRFAGQRLAVENTTVLDEAAQGRALALIAQYRKGAVTDELVGGLHALLAGISKVEANAAPLQEDEKALYAAYGAGFLYGVLEGLAGASYIDKDRPFVNERHFAYFRQTVVEAQLLLGSAKQPPLQELLAQLRKLQAEPGAGTAQVLSSVRDIDRRIEGGASLGAVYPGVLAAINELAALGERSGSEPLAVAELLRLLDLYADRAEFGAIDNLKQNTLQALPAAVKAIQGAA